MKALREQFEAELRMRPEYSSKAEIRWEARTRAQEVFAPVHDGVARWATLDAVQCYAALFRDRELFLELCGEAGPPEGFAAIGEQTLAHLSEGRLPYEDIAPLLFLKNALEGVEGRSEIRHVVVDEAQDYSPCHYAVFRQEFPRARFTILGDLNQSIHPHMYVKRYEDVVAVYDAPSAALLQLYKSYRSTQEIVAFTKGLLRRGEPVEAILRSGPPPRVVHLKDDAVRNEAVIRDVADLKAQGMRSIALICKTEAEAARVHAQLGGVLGAGRVRADGRDPSSGVVVIPAYLAKGLEFDAVLVADAGASTYGHEDERKLLYTACTVRCTGFTCMWWELPRRCWRGSIRICTKGCPIDGFPVQTARSEPAALSCQRPEAKRRERVTARISMKTTRLHQITSRLRSIQIHPAPRKSAKTPELTNMAFRR